MKKALIISSALVLVVVSNLFAQTAPRKEFTVSLSETNINLVAGQSQTYDITINRSKAFKKAEIKLVIDNTLPAGVTISFADGANPLTERKMTVSTESNLANFSNTIILKAKSRRVTKGVMFKLNSSEESLTSK